MVSLSHMKVFDTTVQGSDDDDEVKESEEINGSESKGEITAGKRYVEKQLFRVKYALINWIVACHV